MQITVYSSFEMGKTCFLPVVCGVFSLESRAKEVLSGKVNYTKVATVNEQVFVTLETLRLQQIFINKQTMFFIYFLH